MNKTSSYDLECKTVILVVGVIEGGGGTQSEITTTKTVCKKVIKEIAEDNTCINVSPNGECNIGDGGGGGGGYPYEDTEEEDSCAKVKTNLNNTKFKEKFNKLTKAEVFNLDHETGAFERYPPKENTSIQPSFADIENKIGTTNMDLPDDKSGIIGLLHSHNNEDKNGNHPVKIFSPTDVRTFINYLMPQSNNYTGSYTNAYSVVTTSEGNYILKYTKDTWPGSINYDTKDAWQKWYEKEYTNLLKNDAMTQANVEKLFTQFLKEVVKIDGLELYKVTESTSKKLEYNGKNEPVKSTQCP
ncbi:hypothetical protein [Halpernia sp.]|uniref:hypothetical protein n=1 Tax=Halpernia sp. TaxID=2782209 RepID=UPI003A9455FE